MRSGRWQAAPAPSRSRRGRRGHGLGADAIHRAVEERHHGVVVIRKPEDQSGDRARVMRHDHHLRSAGTIGDVVEDLLVAVRRDPLQLGRARRQPQPDAKHRLAATRKRTVEKARRGVAQLPPSGAAPASCWPVMGLAATCFQRPRSGLFAGASGGLLHQSTGGLPPARSPATRRQTQPERTADSSALSRCNICWFCCCLLLGLLLLLPLQFHAALVAARIGDRARGGTLLLCTHIQCYARCGASQCHCDQKRQWRCSDSHA